MTTLQNWLLFGHILAAMVWIGGIAMLGAFAVRVLRDDDPRAIGRFLATLRRVGPMVLAPAPLALVGFGVALVADSDAFAFSEGWVQAGLAFFGAAFVVGAAHQSRAALAAERAAERGDLAAAARSLRRWAYGMAVIVALLVGATWEMIFKR